jgi:hypothetical protein
MSDATVYRMSQVPVFCLSLYLYIYIYIFIEERGKGRMTTTTNWVRFLRPSQLLLLLLLLLSTAVVLVTPYGWNMWRSARPYCASRWWIILRHRRNGPQMAWCTTFSSSSSGPKNDDIPVDQKHPSSPSTDQKKALVYPIAALERIDRVSTSSLSRTTSNNHNNNKNTSLWSDRRALQHTMTLSEKGWQVSVEWKVSSIGPKNNDSSSSSSSSNSSSNIGVFATQFVAAGTILRVGVRHDNLFPLNSVAEVESFCHAAAAASSQYDARLRYVQDYLWGYYPSHRTDERGYPNGTTTVEDDERFFGMWIPGNGLNHHHTPNTVYRNDRDFFTTHSLTTTNVHRNPKNAALYLVALTDIQAGDELFDDYNRHGRAPPLWLKNYAAEKNMTLNFADCNDFVA